MKLPIMIARRPSTSEALDRPPEEPATSASHSPHFAQVAAARATRREVLRGSLAAAVGGILAPVLSRTASADTAPSDSLLGFRPDELIEQSLSRFISPDETREFLAALREVVERGVTRNARLNPRSASGEVIPTTLNASALRDTDGKVIGAIGILRDMREYEKVVRDLEKSKSELQEKILDLEKFGEVVVGRELKMIALEKDLEKLRKKLGN